MITTCNDCNANRRIVVSENRRSFIIDNRSSRSVNKVTVDSCYMTTGRRCDYLFEILAACVNDSAPDEVFYIELKGSDIRHAVSQLEATLRHCRALHTAAAKECYIVASRYPKSGPSVQTIKKKFKDANDVQLFIGTQQYTKTI